MELKIKLLPTAHTPTRGTTYSAGLDLYTDNIATLKLPEDVAEVPVIEIPPHETVYIESGVSVEIPNGYFGAAYPRSGLSTKQGLRLANCVGVIDSDFRGYIGLPIYNDSNETQIIEHHDRVAQLVIQPYQHVELKISEELGETERGKGGFGSTGK